MCGEKSKEIPGWQPGLRAGGRRELGDLGR